MSSFTLNAGKWASVAKENVVKLSSTAATQATELTKNMNEKVKEGTLLNSVTSKVTDVSSKAWTNINSYWNQSGEGGGLVNSLSNFNMFGRSGYDSMDGETSQFNQPSNNYSGYNNLDKNDWNNWEDSGWESNNSSKKTTQVAKKESKKDEWNNWEDAGWDSADKKDDLMNFNDDDQWEPIDSTSKTK